MTETEGDFVYVDAAGNPVARDAPEVQTRYRRAEYEALDRALVFGQRQAGDVPLLAPDADAPDAPPPPGTRAKK